MTKKLFLILMILPFSAFAICPNLAGQYSECAPLKQIQKESLTISQSRSSGHEVYNIEYQGDEPISLQLIADGVTRSTTTSSGGIDVIVEETTLCKDNQLEYTNSINVLGQVASVRLKLSRHHDGGLLTQVISDDGVETTVCY